jgi:signal transduction histidine kinase
VAAYGTRRVSLLGLGFAVAGAAMVSAALSGGGPSGSPIDNLMITSLMSGGFALAVWVAGSLRGTRWAYLDALVERAHRLEVEREQQSQLAAAAERARIARELHDVAAHSLSVIIAQADGGRYAARAPLSRRRCPAGRRRHGPVGAHRHATAARRPARW